MTDCTCCMSLFVKSSTSAKAYFEDGKIICASKLFQKLVAKNETEIKKNPLDAIIPKVDLNAFSLSAIKKRQPLSFLSEVNRKPIHVEILPIADLNSTVIKIFDLSVIRLMQIAFVTNMKESGLDDLWIFDESYKVAYSRASQEMADKASSPDFDPVDSLEPESREAGKNAFVQCKATPGTYVRHALRTYHAGSVQTMHITMVYLIDIRLGGHYYCCTRFESVSSVSIIKRMHEALGVSTDKELADSFGIDPSVLSRVKHQGGKQLLLRFGAIVWERTGISLDWLFTGKGRMRSQ